MATCKRCSYVCLSLVEFPFHLYFLGKSQFLSFQDSGGSAFHLCFRHSFQSKCLDFAAYFWPRCNDGKSNYIRDKSSRDLELCRCKPRLYKLKAVDALDFYHGLFSGPIKHKLWYIPAGIIVIHFINIIRIVGLSLTGIPMPQHFEFFHNYVFKTFFYFMIFLMWVLWVEVFARKKPEGNMEAVSS